MTLRCAQSRVSVDIVNRQGLRRRSAPARWALLGAMVLAQSAVAQTPDANARPAAAELPTPKPDAIPSVNESGIALLDALTSALQRNRDILVDQTRVAASQGNLQTSSAAFDPKVVSSGELADDRLDASQRQTASAGTQWLRRDGITVGTSVDAVQQRAAPGQASQTTWALRLTFPLLRGRGTEVVTANESIQRLALQGSQYALRESATQQIFNTAQAYWRLRAAEESLAVLREAEGQGERQVRDTQRLVESDEQPASSLNVVRANANSRRAARLDGEKAFNEARLQLGDLMGLDYAQFAALGGAKDLFPDSTGQAIGIDRLQQLVAAGLAQRASLRSAQATLEALRLQMVASRDRLKPELNATLQFGMTGANRQNDPLQLLLRGNVNQRQVTVALNYQWDVLGNEARGRLLTASADHDRQTILLRALQRTVGAGIEAATIAYNHALAQLAESQKTIYLLERAVDGERRKQRLGTATLLDVFNVENSLQNARIAHINNQAAHAIAIAALRFQLGELVQDLEVSATIPIERLLAWNP